MTDQELLNRARSVVLRAVTYELENPWINILRSFEAECPDKLTMEDIAVLNQACDEMLMHVEGECPDTSCPCVEHGYRHAQETVNEWYTPPCVEGR